MLSYKLAKQLKEAGFPRGSKGEYFRVKGGLLIEQDGEKITEGEYYIPTLSELIGACGDRFYFLSRCRLKCLLDKKMIENLWSVCGGYEDKEKQRIEFNINGKSPEESVAKLWLALNKKE